MSMTGVKIWGISYFWYANTDISVWALSRRRKIVNSKKNSKISKTYFQRLEETTRGLPVIVQDDHDF